MLKKLFLPILCSSFYLQAMEGFQPNKLENITSQLAEVALEPSEQTEEGSPHDKETILIDRITISDFNFFQNYSEQFSGFKLSKKSQQEALQTLIGEYNDNKTAPQVLDMLVNKHGVSVNIRESLAGASMLTYASYKACQTGETSLLEAFLKHGANDLADGIRSSYQRICNNIGDKNGFKVLSSFVRHLGVQIPWRFKNDKNYQEYINGLTQLDHETLQNDFLKTIGKQLNPHVLSTALEALDYKQFFEKQKLSPATQESALKIIIENHNNSDFGCFLLSVAIKYGLDLGMIELDGLSGLQYITCHALKSGKTGIFEEALKNGTDINEKGQTGESPFEIIQKANSTNASKLLTCLKENNLIQ